MKKIILTDRSRMIARKECPQMGYLNYEWGGTGLQRTLASLPLLNGIAIHNAHAELFKGRNINDVVDETMDAYEEEFHRRGIWNEQAEKLFQEQGFLLEGMIRTWNHHRLPKIWDEFTLAVAPDGKPFVEHEFTYKLDEGIHVMLRMDAVLRRRDTGELVIWDFKTLGYPSDNWYKQFEHNAQTYLYTEALKAYTGEPVEGIAYEGLVKGMRRTETAKGSPWYGKKVQASPYCYGYVCNADGMKLYQTDYTAKKGYRKTAPWLEAMDPAEWFKQVLLPEHETTGLFNNLFCIVPPINPVPKEVERWKRQARYAEYMNQVYLTEIAEARQAGNETQAQQLTEMYFPTNEERCFKYGPDNQCQFADICFNSVIAEDPLWGGYERRTPHHDTENEEKAA